MTTENSTAKLSRIRTNMAQCPSIVYTVTRTELKALLLDTDGWVLSWGYIWDIKSKSLGAGVYSVSLVKRS